VKRKCELLSGVTLYFRIMKITATENQ